MYDIINKTILKGSEYMTNILEKTKRINNKRQAPNIAEILSKVLPGATQKKENTINYTLKLVLILRKKYHIQEFTRTI